MDTVDLRTQNSPRFHQTIQPSQRVLFFPSRQGIRTGFALRFKKHPPSDQVIPRIPTGLLSPKAPQHGFPVKTPRDFLSLGTDALSTPPYPGRTTRDTHQCTLRALLCTCPAGGQRSPKLVVRISLGLKVTSPAGSLFSEVEPSGTSSTNYTPPNQYSLRPTASTTFGVRWRG